MKKTCDTWASGNPSPYQGRDLTHFPDWGNLIVWDAFFNNLTAGLMFIIGIGWLFGPPVLLPILPLALTLALLLVLTDLVILILDLADPLRFIHSLRVMRFTSPLSVGVWGLVSYSIFAAIAVLLSWVVWCTGGTALSNVFIKAVLGMSIALAMMGAAVVLCYKGVVFSCSSQPGVCNARWLPPFMISDAMLMGLGLYVLVCITVDASLSTFFIAPMIALLGARCIAFGLLWQDVKKRARLMYSRENTLIGWCVLCVGSLIPLILVFLGPIGLGIAAILVISCGVLERYWIIGMTRPAAVGSCGAQ